jgi:hypothetical protein
MADADTRAFFVMTLGRLGRPQPGCVSSMWQKRATLTPFGLAFLGVAASELQGDHGLVKPILRALACANLGDAYAKVGRIDDARRAYARFLELRPDHKIAPTVRERLAKLPHQHP